MTAVMNTCLLAISRFNAKSLGVIALLFLLANGEKLFAQSLEFPTGTGAMTVGDLDVPGNAITVEGLIYMEKNTGSGNIVSKHLNPSTVNYLLRPLSFELTAYNSGYSGPTHFIRVINPSQLSLNRWYHIAGTYDGKRVKYYVNGCLVIDSAFTGNLYQNNFLTTIGNRNSCLCEPFFGKIDEVRIWNTARSQQEIAENMLVLPNPPAQQGLLACYEFNGDYTNSAGNAAWNGKQIGNPFFSTGGAAIQSFEVTGIQTGNADCEKVSNGNLIVSANRSDAVFSIDGIHYQNSNQFAALKTGNYTVYTKNPEGCLAKNTATIGNNHEFVPLSLSGSLCRGGSYLGHSAAGTYTDTVAAASGCDTLRTLLLADNARSIVSNDVSICEGTSYLGHQASGKYTDTLVGSNGCDSIRILQLTVVPRPRPDLGGSRSICKGDSINLSPGRYNSYLWQDGTSTDHMLVTQAGLYSVQVVNACGSKQEQVLITDGYCGVFFPNAFTPNSDGHNDQFKPVVYSLSNFRWKIFNRAGQVVFETNEYNKGWDGRVKGQSPVSGVYVWICTYTRKNKVEMKKGTLVLIR
jgi:gliding motility-associated-like protein